MPGAVIVANQATGAGAGSPGVARKDLWQSRQINLVVGTSGNSSVEWSILWKPIGSSSTLTNASQSGGGPYSDCTFTPDLVGTYRIQLVTNGGGPGNVSVLVFRVRYDSSGVLANRGWAYPAAGEVDGESNYGGNTAGWGEVLETILEDVRIFVASGGGVPPSRTITSGGGLTGGGDLSADRTIAVGSGTGITVNADDIAVDTTVIATRLYAESYAESYTDSVAPPNGRLITAGSGLTGGGDLSADRTINVGAGTGITVNADDVALDTTAIAETHDVSVIDSGYQTVPAAASSGWYTIASFLHTSSLFSVGSHGSLSYILRAVCSQSVSGLTSHMRIVKASDLSTVASSSLTFSSAFSAPQSVESAALTFTNGEIYFIQADALGSDSPSAFASIHAKLVARMVL